MLKHIAFCLCSESSALRPVFARYSFEEPQCLVQFTMLESSCERGGVHVRRRFSLQVRAARLHRLRNTAPRQGCGWRWGGAFLAFGRRAGRCVRVKSSMRPKARGRLAADIERKTHLPILSVHSDAIVHLFARVSVAEPRIR